MLSIAKLDESGETKVGYEFPHPYDCGDVSSAAAGCLDIDLNVFGSWLGGGEANVRRRSILGERMY